MDSKHVKRQTTETTPPLPAISTSVPPAELMSFLIDLREDVRDVKSALRGDQFGNPGMVDNLQSLTKNHEEHVEDDTIRFAAIEHKITYWGGAIGGIIGAIELYILIYK